MRGSWKRLVLTICLEPTLDFPSPQHSFNILSALAKSICAGAAYPGLFAISLIRSGPNESPPVGWGLGSPPMICKYHMVIAHVLRRLLWKVKVKRGGRLPTIPNAPTTLSLCSYLLFISLERINSLSLLSLSHILVACYE